MKKLVSEFAVQIVQTQNKLIVNACNLKPVCPPKRSEGGKPETCEAKQSLSVWMTRS